MFNKRRYSSEIAVLDMSTVILHNTFRTTTELVKQLLFATQWLSVLSLSSVILPS